MKKLVLSIVLATAFGFALTSCDPDVRKCYKFTYEMEILGEIKTIETYEWMSRNEADAQKEKLETEYGIKVSRTIAKDHKVMEDCINANLDKNN
jgi:hypothetical protein